MTAKIVKFYKVQYPMLLFLIIIVWMVYPCDVTDDLVLYVVCTSQNAVFFFFFYCVNIQREERQIGLLSTKTYWAFL